MSLRSTFYFVKIAGFPLIYALMDQNPSSNLFCPMGEAKRPWLPNYETILNFFFRCLDSEDQQFINLALIYNSGTSADSEGVVKQNNFVSPYETTVVESGNVFFFLFFLICFFAFVIVSTDMLTTEKPTGDVLSCLR